MAEATFVGNRKGFTLVELVVAMAIIALLALLIIGAIVIARRVMIETVHRENARVIHGAMEAYYGRNKRYPPVVPGGLGPYYDSFAGLKTRMENGIGGDSGLGSGGVTLADTPQCRPGWNREGGGKVYDYGRGELEITPADYTCAYD